MISSRKRLPDWEQRLFTFLNSAKDKRLEWGGFDCLIGLASGAVEAQTGIDLAASFKGEYTSWSEAMTILKQEGFRVKGRGMAPALSNAMDAYLRRARKGDMHRGNIVLLESDEGPGFGVRVGFMAVVLSSLGGTHQVRIPTNAKEWTVI